MWRTTRPKVVRVLPKWYRLWLSPEFPQTLTVSAKSPISKVLLPRLVPVSTFDIWPARQLAIHIAKRLITPDRNALGDDLIEALGVPKSVVGQ